jgi:crotonobetaine/carnitine-CoA ligase
VPQVLEAAVVPVPDELRGEEVKAYLRVAPEAAADATLLEAVLAHCRANLAPFKVPRYLELVEEFPRTPSNKIRKAELLAANTDLRAGAYDAIDRRWR